MENKEIPNGWIETTLGEIVNIGRGSSPRPIQYYLSDKGIPWVKIADATASNTRFIKTTKEFIIEEGRSTSVKVGDLIVSNSATPGIPKIMGIDACVHDGWLIFSGYKNIDILFLFYFFLDFRKILNRSASGTVFKNLTTEIVRTVLIKLPPLPEQKAIANVLSSLDEKIELLEEENKTLETLAQTIFTEWFVNFNFPGATGEMEESELGEIPRGWRVGKLGEEAIYVSDFVANGSFASLKENVNLYNDKTEYALFMRNTDLKSNFKEKVFVDKHSYEFLSKTKLFGGEIIISNVGDVGSVYQCPYFNMPMTLGNNVIMLKSYFNNFLYLLFKGEVGQHLLYGITGGSAQPKFNKTDFKSLELVMPSDKILMEFEEITQNVFRKTNNNLMQIETLKGTRDTLLPKLMSGEIRVEGFGGDI